MNQTENYLILKPLSTRINRICSEMSDAEIKSIIKEAVKERVCKAIQDGIENIPSVIEDFLDRNQDAIYEAVKESILSSLNIRDFRTDWNY